MRRFLKIITVYLFKVFSKAGIYFLPSHYYVPLANINDLKKTKQIWAKKSDLPAIHSDLDQQVKNLEKICLPYQQEYIGNKNYLKAVEEFFGPGYGFVEAQALHGFIRFYKPGKIIEIGSGVSTYCMIKANEINCKEENIATQITCIEPFPSDKIKAQKNVELIQERVQKIPFSKFEELSANDFLFIDSSHTVRPGGDVNYLILEILPRLSKGVVVHFHDIFLPYDYPRNVLNSYFQWMETSLLRAFLINNHKVRIIFCLSQLHYERKRALRKVFPDYIPANDENGLETESIADPNKKHFPASIYLEIL